MTKGFVSSGGFGVRWAEGNLCKRRGLFTFTMASCWVSAPEFGLLGYIVLWELWEEKYLSARARTREKQASALVREALLSGARPALAQA